MHSVLLFLTSTRGPKAEVWKASKWDCTPDNNQRLFTDEIYMIIS